MSADANYASIPRFGTCTLTTGDTSRSAPATTGTVLTATTTASSGTRIDGISIAATGPTVDSWLRFFIYTGAAYSFQFEVKVPAQTPDTRTPAWQKTFGTNFGDFADQFPMILPTGHSLRVSVNDTQAGIVVSTDNAGDFS